MHESTVLLDLCPGEKAQIKALLSQEKMRRRLLDLGFTRSTPIECLYRAAAGDPTAYWIRGTVIALRAEEARNIQIHRC